MSASSDSSSLLPITELQEQTFPGTHAVEKRSVATGPLSLAMGELGGDCVLLKLDVQGFELEALKGCKDFLSEVSVVYCECSFSELYTGQALAPEIDEYLRQFNFRLLTLNNPQLGKDGSVMQADFVFVNSKFQSQ